MQNIKCVAVGDGAVGKTCLLISYCMNKFPDEYIPTVFDNYQSNKTIDGKEVTFGLWDTAGQEDYDRLRPLSYPNTDMFLLCFDLTNPDSLSNAEQKWYKEINTFWTDEKKNPKCFKVPMPFILVGTKMDLRNDPEAQKKATNEGKSFVTKEMGEKVAKNIHAVAYVECSARTQENLSAVFDTVLREGLKMKESLKKKGDCIIM